VDAVTTPSLTEQELALLSAVDAREDELVESLATLVRFRTPNPPGANELEAQDWIEERFRELGCEIDRWDALPGRPNVIGTLKSPVGGGPTVSLNSHIDVCQDALLDAWTQDAYDPWIDGGDMVGRGATDMKCAMASFMFAVRVLNDHGIVLKGDVELQSVIGEEAGEPGTRSAIEHGYGGDFAIVGESSSGEGIVASIGVMTARIVIESPYTLHLVARKFTINAGGAREGANCAEKMALRIIPALSDLERQWGVFKTHPLVPPGACNINVFRVEGGDNPFLLPDRAVAYVTVTYLPNERKEDVMAEVEAHVQAAASLDGWLQKHPPRVEWGPAEYPIEFAACDIDLESEPVLALRGAIEGAGREPVLGGRGGITDAGWFARAGIESVVFGPGDVDYAHVVDERVHLVDVVAHCKAIVLLLLRYCGTADAG
jgi:acetylornithine deacetylase/succinyl-diaminopimelate desuccinylase family protein